MSRNRRLTRIAQDRASPTFGLKCSSNKLCGRDDERKPDYGSPGCFGQMGSGYRPTRTWKQSSTSIVGRRPSLVFPQTPAIHRELPECGERPQEWPLASSAFPMAVSEPLARSQTAKVVPTPTSVLTSIAPPNARTMLLTIASPSPLPPLAALVVKNGSKICSSTPGGIPGPLSLTNSRT